MSGAQGNHTFHRLINLVLWSILVSYLGLLFVFGRDGEQVPDQQFPELEVQRMSFELFCPGNNTPAEMPPPAILWGKQKSTLGDGRWFRHMVWS